MTDATQTQRPITEPEAAEHPEVDPHDQASAPVVSRSPALDSSGAVAGDGMLAGVAAHYGDPMREQRALEAAGAQVDLSARGVVTIAGTDRLSWLHSLTSQHLNDLAPFTSTESLILSPHGHIEFVLHLVDDGSTTWITTDPGRSGDLVAWLERMKFMLRVEIADASDSYAVIGRPTGQGATQAQRDAGVVVWRDPWPQVSPGGVAYSDVSPHPAEGRAWSELIVPRERFMDFFAGDLSDGLVPAGWWAAEALRIAAWRPDGLAEVDHRTIAHELDWLRTAVHLQKGCYRGQETIARVHNLGRPPRRLAFVHLDGSGHVLPEVGSDVVVPGATRPVGRLTSVARHHVDGPIGLVVVKRSTSADATFVIDGIAATQTVVVSP